MTGADFLLSKLPLYKGQAHLLKQNQSVDDIIKGVKMVHKKYAINYDAIAEYFVGETPEQTCKNLFNFLRRSSFYYVEGDNEQTLRSSSAILATGRTLGLDCKNYSLFIAGVLDAVNRSGVQEIPYVYRFASDLLFDPTPCHVFVVAWPGTDDEIWIDPIPQVSYFNEHLTYYYYTDKNIHDMSLNVISGRRMGDTQSNNLVSQVANVIPFGSVALSLFNMASQPDNSQNWVAKDWPWWIDEDPSSHPANNFIVFFSKNPDFIRTMPWDNSPNSGIKLTTQQKVDRVRARLTREGMGSQINSLLQAYGYNNPATIDTLVSGQTGIANANGTLTTATSANASQNKLLTYGLIGGAIILVLANRKKVSGKSNNTLLWVGGAAVVGYFLLKQKGSAALPAGGNISDTPVIQPIKFLPAPGIIDVTATV